MSPAHAACSASRKTYYQWLAKAEQYGLSALLPSRTSPPHQPNAMSMEEVSVILAEAVARPTWGLARCCGTSTHEGCTARPRGGRRSCTGTTLGTARLRVAYAAS